jgi:hypothetical protein
MIYALTKYHSITDHWSLALSRRMIEHPPTKSFALQAEKVNQAGFADPSLPLAVVVASTRWDEPPRMRHQVTRQLMRWFNVLFVEFLPSRRQAPSAGYLRRVDERLLIFAPQTRFPVPIHAYANIPPVHWAVNRGYRDRIVETVQSLGSRPVMLFNFVYDFPEIMALSLFSYKIYFCFDEWPRMWRRASKPWGPKFFYQSRLYQHYENQVARRADRCLATHTPLEEKLRRVNPGTSLFLLAHEFNRIASFRPLVKSRAPIKVGFMGYITYRLMADWLTSVLNEEDIELFLIGPLSKLYLQPFLERKNFTHVPPLVGDSLLDKLAEMDVLIQPYDPRIPENHVQTVSNKFFQYVAAGRPVVISDMPHYLEMPKGVLYRAKTAGEFINAIRQAHAEDCPEFVETRLRIARENTWDKRGDSLYSMIQRAWAGKLPSAVAQAA